MYHLELRMTRDDGYRYHLCCISREINAELITIAKEIKEKYVDISPI